VIQSRKFEPDFGRLAEGIVDANLLDEAAIAWTAAVGRNDPIERGLFSTSASES
jgi:hypothetical protein